MPNMTRSEAREQAFIIIFESLFHPDESVEDILRENTAEVCATVSDFAKTTAEKAIEYAPVSDEKIRENSKKWKIDRLSKVTRAILRLSVYELLKSGEIPASVAINEAVELAKKYGGEDEYVFINGVLGALAKTEELPEEPEKHQKAKKE